MENFAEQCLDMARSILSQNLDAIEDNGQSDHFQMKTQPAMNQGMRHLQLVNILEQQTKKLLDGHNLFDLAARTITAQAFAQESHEGGLAYASLGLLSFGSAKDRNPIWERLLEPLGHN